jgi:hypothetical protein
MCRAAFSRTAGQLTIGTDVRITVTSYSVDIQKLDVSLLKYLQLTRREPQASIRTFHSDGNPSLRPDRDWHARLTSIEERDILQFICVPFRAVVCRPEHR